MFMEAMSMFGVLNTNKTLTDVHVRERLRLTVEHRQFLVDAANSILGENGTFDRNGKRNCCVQFTVHVICCSCYLIVMSRSNVKVIDQ